MRPGWFDAFRTDGGPTLYSASNRTPVTGDVHSITLYLCFFTVFVAFLLIFPGVRKERFTTFTSVTLSLFVGTVILVARYGSSWHVAETRVHSSYRAFSRERLDARLGAYIGLNHVNITLRAMPRGNRSEDIDFNERFEWLAPGEMGAGYREGLRRGLPFPVLTAAEYFSLGQEGFAWGAQYRAAGYYVSILLWAAFALWLLMNLLLVVVPRYGAYAMALTGAVLAGADLAYWALLPARPLLVRLEGGTLAFRLGWCFWLVLAAGVLCLLVGLAIAAVDLAYPHRFSTILEVDYDTPYDRHIIIEESHYSHYKSHHKRSKGHGGGGAGGQTRSLEEPPGAGIGSRILRRISKRGGRRGAEWRGRSRSGVSNEAFEMDAPAPASPWRYPFQRPFARNLHLQLQRSLSADSGSSAGDLGSPAGPPPLTQHQVLAAAMEAAAAGAATGAGAASNRGLALLQRHNSAATRSTPGGGGSVSASAAAAANATPVAADSPRGSTASIQTPVAMW